MSLILMTTLFYKELLLQGEIWCWSLLGLKGLNSLMKRQCTMLYNNCDEYCRLRCKKNKIKIKWKEISGDSVEG